MKYVYAHFPINLVVSKDNKVVDVKNYLGEKMERTIVLLGDTTAKLSKDIDGTKDEITIQGSSLDAVSQSCANIQQIAKVKDKDIRKFLVRQQANADTLRRPDESLLLRFTAWESKRAAHSCVFPLLSLSLSLSVFSPCRTVCTCLSAATSWRTHKWARRLFPSRASAAGCPRHALPI